MDCNFLAPMDANGAVGDGFDIASIKSSAALVVSFLLVTNGILLCSGENSTVSVINSYLVSLFF